LTINDHAGHLAELAEHLQIDRVHWVGHSSGCQIVLQLALEHPELVRTLTLLEPAAGGGFAVPAAEELGREFVGPAIAAFKGGDLNTAFDLFMRGVGGNDYRAVLEQRLGTGSVQQAISQSAFFFQDEVPAVLESRFGPTDAARVRCPILVAEGADSATAGLLSRQITARAIQLFPHAEVVRIAATNHLMPLQNPEAVAQVIRDFVGRHSS
jgi:pimeloyl-ACP methyl ester carboxylesterase